MEDKKKETFEEHVRKIVTPIFDKILNEKSKPPQEISKDTMCVSKSSVDKRENPIIFYWRPNNYRLQIPFNKENIDLGINKENLTLLREKRKGSVVTTKKGKIKVSNFGSKLNCRIDGLSIMIDKRFATITYSLRSATQKNKSEKATYKIEARNLNEIHKRIDERVKEIKEICINAIKKFIKLYGGKADIDSAKFTRHEDSVHAEDWIPDEAIIYDTHFKKVYPREVEFKNPTFVKNFYSNRVIEEIAPEIAKEIKDNNNSIEDIKKVIIVELNPILRKFTKQIKLHLEVQEETKKTLKEIRKPFFVRWWNYFKEKWNAGRY